MTVRFSVFAPLLLATVMSGQSLLNHNVTLSGTVKSVDGKNIDGVKVQAVDAHNGSIAATTYTNVSGQFQLDNLRAGDYEVIAQSGVLEARERVDARMNGSIGITLRLPRTEEHAGSLDNATVSVAQFKVPKKARQAYEKAVAAIAKRRLEDTDRYIAEALNIFPVYSDALTLRAVRKLDQTQVDSAIADLDAAIKADASNARAMLVMAACLNRQQKYDDAIRILNRADALAPNAWQGFYEMAKAHFGKADYAAALKWLDRAQTSAPATFTGLRVTKARTLVALKEYSRAVTELQAFLLAAPQDPQAPQVRALLDQVKGFANK